MRLSFCSRASDPGEELACGTPRNRHHYGSARRVAFCGSEDAAPQENVGVVKQRRITAAALRYLHGSQSFGKEAFFDVISVILYPDGTEIEYFPCAWIPMYV